MKLRFFFGRVLTPCYINDGRVTPDRDRGSGASGANAIACEALKN